MNSDSLHVHWPCDLMGEHLVVAAMPCNPPPKGDTHMIADNTIDIARPHADERVRNGIARSAIYTTVAGMALLAALSMFACRTTEGLGRDVEKLGDNIADSADKHTP